MKRFVVLVTTIVLLLTFQVVAVCGTIANIAKKVAVDNAKYCSDRIGDKVEESLNLLTSLADTSAIQNDELTYREKAAALTKISSQFGYMMIRILDSDLRVYNENSPNKDGASSDLSKRDYLQKLKRTLEPQVTDAFLAGSDGKTINFTIAVPIIKDGVFHGALFAAIYEADFAELLAENSSVLLGKNLQYMSGTDAENVGLLLDTELEEFFFFGTTAEERMLEIMGLESTEGCFLGIHSLEALAFSYNKVLNADWNVISKVSFVSVIADNPIMFVVMMLSLTITTVLLVLVLLNKSRLSRPNKETVEQSEHS